MRIDDDLIDEALRGAPAWRPSHGFAERVAAQAAGVMSREELAPPSPWSFTNIAATVAVAIVAAVAIDLVFGLFITWTPAVTAVSASTAVTSWVWVAASAAVAAWFTVRAHAAD
jgi:hypothetical protein